MKVFIDGKTGTTGLNIYERLGKRSDVTIIALAEEDRHNDAARRQALNNADVAFLCLPDAAAVESAAMVTNPDTIVIDASTAHRTDNDWSYGFAELGEGFENAIRHSKRIAVPGCHASGFIALIYPLVEAGIIAKDSLLSCFSLTGYSGGGKKMIAEYEAADRSPLLDAPRHYALTQQHKHLKEMAAITGIDNAPGFCPVVGDFYSGMLVTITIFKQQLCSGMNAESIKNCYKNKYNDAVVSYVDNADEQGFMSAGALSGMDNMQISVFGNEDRILLVARYDNLGKGACGAALECLNIATGADKTCGLTIK